MSLRERIGSKIPSYSPEDVQSAALSVTEKSGRTAQAARVMQLGAFANGNGFLSPEQAQLAQVKAGLGMPANEQSIHTPSAITVQQAPELPAPITVQRV